MRSPNPLAGSRGLGRQILVALAAPALLIIASCSQDDGLGKRYPVSGTVTYNGAPLEKGIISFVSENLRDNIGASGEIKNGSYKLSTGGGEDGAQAGKYKVTITAKEDFRAKALADFRKETGPGESTYIPPQYVSKAEAAAKSLIPTGYGNPSTTNLTAEVKPQSNTIDFPLSDKDAPPAPAAPAKGAGHK